MAGWPTRKLWGCGLSHDELGTAESVLACSIGDNMGTTLGRSCHMPHKALLGISDSGTWGVGFKL